MYAIPAAVAFYGLASTRLGFVLGPVALVGVSFLASAVLRQIDEAALATIGQSTLAPVSQPYQVVAVDGTDLACDQACIRFLAVSPYVLAKRSEHSKGWRTFARGEGDVCLADEHAADVLEFITAGYRGMCVLRGLSEDIDRAIIYRARQVSRDNPLADAPRSFHGWVHEASERNGGTERVLGRRLIGALNSPLPRVIAAFGVKARQVDIGPRLDRDTFLAAGAGVTRAQLESQGPLSFAARLDEIERHFGRQAKVGNARQSIADLALQKSRMMVQSEGRSHPAEVRARVERLLASDDPNLIANGLTDLATLSFSDRAFARDALIALAFGPLPAARNSPIVAPLQRLLGAADEPFAPDIRERAKLRFLRDTGPTLGQRQLWFIIVTRGSTTMRSEAVDMLFALEGAAFEEGVRAIGRGEERRVGRQPAQPMVARGDRAVDRARRRRAHAAAQELPGRVPFRQFHLGRAEGDARCPCARALARRRTRAGARPAGDRCPEAADRDHPGEHRLVTRDDRDLRLHRAVAAGAAAPAAHVTARARRSPHRSSRAIRLDVSQRRPPIFWISE